MWTKGGTAWDGLSGGRAEPGLLCGCRVDIWEIPHPGSVHPDSDSGNVPKGRSLDQPGKDKGSGMHFRLHLG